MSTEDLVSRLKKILEETHSSAIQEVKTQLENVSIAVLPESKTKPKSLAVIVRTPGKWKGTFLRSKSELSELKRMITDPKVEQLVEAIEKLNPKLKKAEGIKIEI
ncbi:MAG: hypothetical protein HY929_04750 [Euryarchaeota archaeon]|nr:hypothetical protein [Euryarchaeota archaeon]